MRPKGKLFALLAIFAAIGLITATGAFTSVQAERTAVVEVQGDAAALLGLEPNSTSPNGDGAYARTAGNGQLQLVLNNSVNPGEGGTGLNTRATTQLDHVFNITNRGTQEVEVTISLQVNTPGNLNPGIGSGSPNFYLYPGADNSTDLSSSPMTLTQGQTRSVGVYVDTRGLSQGDTIDITINIEANAT